MTTKSNTKPLFAALALVAALAGGANAVELQPLNENMMRELVQIDPSRFQQVAMPAAISGKGCTFYSEANGGGESWHKAVGWLAQRFDNQDSYSEYVTTTGEWWNDNISSMQCDESEAVRCSIALYRDTNKGGGDIILWGSQGMINLADWGWDNMTSSYQIFCNHMRG